MSIRSKLLVLSLILIVFYLATQTAVFFYTNNQISSRTIAMTDELHRQDREFSMKEINSLGDTLETFLMTKEDEIDDSMYHAALTLQMLDTMTTVTLSDMNRLLNELRVDDLYLADMDGKFTLSTVPNAVGGIGLFEIWDGYRMLVTGEAKELPSAIKVMVETGDIYKFTAIPRYDANGNIKGIVESALEVSGIESNIEAMISNYSMINSFHLFEDGGLTLLSVEKPGARNSYEKAATASSILSDISSAFTSASSLISTPGDGSIVYYQTINRFGGPAYVMRMELEESFYTESTDYTKVAVSDLEGYITSNILLLAGLGFICMILITISYLALIGKAVLKPVKVLSGFMNKAGSTGDITMNSADVNIIDGNFQRNDEIGQCIAACSVFVRRITEVADNIVKIADGDLTNDISLLSEQDVMGESLQKMNANLNEKFNLIAVTTHQVNEETRQIAGGSQDLADSTTKQAADIINLHEFIDELYASIQKLYTSIGIINDKTKQNADIAREAAILSNAIKANSERGSEHMDQMVSAVKEINDASNQISDVVNIISEITNQTNMLALNAAIESARAGEAGKGFAVVATEVRNLAARSMEATENIGSLITNSMQKANFGLQIASETAASLHAIVDGINKSAEIFSQISQLSDEQSVGIEQLNQGIGHVNSGIGQVKTGVTNVSDVVQQNSATAQESAASSQELREHSNVLDKLVMQFKLKK